MELYKIPICKNWKTALNLTTLLNFFFVKSLFDRSELANTHYNLVKVQSALIIFAVHFSYKSF